MVILFGFDQALSIVNNAGTKLNVEAGKMLPLIKTKKH
jgi:hypothetical protein